MRSPPQSDNPDAAKTDEMAAADQACERLIERLRHLEQAMDDLKQGPALGLAGGFKKRQLRLKHEAMLQMLQRHAQNTLKKYAFVNGERMDHPDERLLTAFYSDPKDSVSARYCWALLRETSHPDPPLRQLIAATLAEREAFKQAQIDKEASNEAGAHEDLETRTAPHQKRADRLFYTVALLQRLLLLEKQEGGPATSKRRELELEIAELSESAHVAASDLRKDRLKWLAAKRTDPGSD